MHTYKEKDEPVIRLAHNITNQVARMNETAQASEFLSVPLLQLLSTFDGP